MVSCHSLLRQTFLVSTIRVSLSIIWLTNCSISSGNILSPLAERYKITPSPSNYLSASFGTYLVPMMWSSVLLTLMGEFLNILSTSVLVNKVSVMLSELLLCESICFCVSSF